MSTVRPQADSLKAARYGSILASNMQAGGALWRLSPALVLPGALRDLFTLNAQLFQQHSQNTLNERPHDPRRVELLVVAHA